MLLCCSCRFGKIAIKTITNSNFHYFNRKVIRKQIKIEQVQFANILYCKQSTKQTE